jgi:hypothetical protein
VTRSCVLCETNPTTERAGWPVPALYCGSCMSFSEARAKRNAAKPAEPVCAAIKHGVRTLLASLPPAELAAANRAAWADMRRASFSVVAGGKGTQ